MDAQNVMGLLAGALCGLLSLAVGVSEAGPNPQAAGPAVERSLEDLAAFHNAALEDALFDWSASADALQPFYEPAPGEACDDGLATVEQVVQDVTRELHRRRIPYHSANLTDCSGMMHRVLQEVAGRCEGVERPSVVRARRAKDLARWYRDAGRLTSVQSAADIDDALTVGSVAFFLAPGRQHGGLDRIFHIGLITAIERDGLGRIQSYSMFHGRRPGFPASITHWHVRDRVPALGNGTERMVAVAWPSDAVLPAYLRSVEPHRSEDAFADGGAPTGAADTL